MPVSLNCNMQDVQEEILKLDKGLDLVISYNRMSVRGVANQVLAVNRMKKPTGCLNTQLSDAELCSSIMDSRVEGGRQRTSPQEHLNTPASWAHTRLPFLPTERIVTIPNHPSMQAPRPAYLRINSRDNYALSDTSQKAVVKDSGLNLQAVTMKGGHNDRRGKRIRSKN